MGYLELAFEQEDPLFAVAAPGRRGRQLTRTPRAKLVWPNGYRVGELMATQSGRILVGALDRIVCSSANYWVAMLSDLAAALAFLALGLNRFSGPWVVAGAVVIVGFMSLGLLEYVLLT